MIELLMIGGLFLGGVIYAAMTIHTLRREVAYLHALLADAAPGVISPPTPAPEHIDLAPVSATNSALRTPPTRFETLLEYTNAKRKTYTFPVGWQSLAYGTPQAEIDLVTASFVDDVNHILLTGQTRIGKDNAFITILLALATQYDPDKVQLAIVDGKGLDFAPFERKAHIWRLALDTHEIRPAMTAITEERHRRGRILRAAQVSKWENYAGSDLPLLVVYISELSLLEDATSKTDLTDWLNSELAAGAAFGIRFVVATQTASNFATRWRSQISLYLAGFQPSQSQDSPNTGLTTSEIKALGCIPPSELPEAPRGAGVFLAVQGRTAFNVRSSNLDDAQRQRIIARLPNAPQKALQPETAATPQNSNDAYLLHLLNTGQPLPVSGSTLPDAGSTLPRLSTAVNEGSGSNESNGSAETKLRVSDTSTTLPVATEIVPEDEQRAILEAAPRHSSRGALCQELFNTRGGRAYERVKLVLDAAGL